MQSTRHKTWCKQHHVCKDPNREEEEEIGLVTMMQGTRHKTYDASNSMFAKIQVRKKKKKMTFFFFATCFALVTFFFFFQNMLLPFFLIKKKKRKKWRNPNPTNPYIAVMMQGIRHETYDANNSTLQRSKEGRRRRLHVCKDPNKEEEEEDDDDPNNFNNFKQIQDLILDRHNFRQK